MTADLSSTGVRPRTWLDAFPWMKGAADPQTDGWWDQVIDNTDISLHRQRLAEISELAMARLTRWTIGQIFPGLSPDINLLHLQLPTRAANALTSRLYFRGVDLTGVTLDEMLDWRQVGVGTIDSILQTLADASTSITVPTTITAEHHAAMLQSGTPPKPVRLRGWMLPIVDDLSKIANWYASIGLPRQQILAGTLIPGAPDEIIKARQRLEALSADDVLAEHEPTKDAAAHLDDALRTLDERAIQILSARLFADHPMTLDQLGKKFGVSRERVRQIESRAHSVMHDLLNNRDLLSNRGSLGLVAETARNLIGTVRPLADLLTLLPGLASTVDTVEKPAWRVLDRLDDAYEIEDGWCAAPTMTSAQAMTETILEERADQYGVVRIDDLELVESSDPEQVPELTAAWLTHCGYVVDGDFVLTRTQSVGDYGAAVLSITGSPLSAQEIVDRFVVDRTAGSLRNAMSQDDRFERVDRDGWALREWGMDTYAGIRALIREQIARGGGRVRMNELVEHITGRYTVTASSVVAYANSLPFEVKEGFVRLADANREIRKSPERTRRLFRHPGAWYYRIRITKDHLRGSGSIAPMAIATIAGLQFGESRQLASPLGPQTVGWTGTQPAFGTIRRFLTDGDVAIDAEAFLVVGDDGSFLFEPMRELTGVALDDAISLIGAPLGMDMPAALQTLAHAIGLPDNAPVTSIIGGYRERDDSDIADILTSIRAALETASQPEQKVHTTDVDEILDLL